MTLRLPYMVQNLVVEFMLKDLIPTSSTSCLNSRFIINKGITYEVPCRHCVACQSVRRVHLLRRADAISRMGKYGLFITLTYKYDSLPLAFYGGRGSVSLYRGDNTFISFIPVDHHFTSDDFYRPIKSVTDGRPFKTLSRCQAVLYKPDLQNFMKRLRRSIDYHFKNLNIYDKRIFYFAVGEYGPTSLRPHYHVLLWSNNPQVLSYVQQNIFSCWPHCDRQSLIVKPCDKATSSYLSGYVCASSSLPLLLQERKFMQFHVGSKKDGFLYPHEMPLLVTAALSCGCTSFSTIDQHGSRKDLRLSKEDFLSIFPQPTGYNSLSSRDKYSLFLRYSFHFCKDKSSSYQDFNQRLVTDSFSYTDFKFYRSVLFYSSQTFVLPIIQGDQVVSYYEAKFDPYSLIKLVDHVLYKLDMQYLHDLFTYLEDVYDRVSFDSFDIQKLALYFYKDKLRLLPNSLSFIEFKRRFGERFFGLSYFQLYHDGLLDIDGLDYSPISDYNRKVLERDLLNHIKTKKLNSNIYSNIL